jgi:hypothetical protein
VSKEVRLLVAGGPGVSIVMTVRSPTATLDEGWASLLDTDKPARAVAPMTAVGEVLADILYFYEQGLVDDATAMFEDLRRRNPGDPSLEVAPWDAPPEQDDAVEAAWDADEADILAALDMLNGYPDARDAALLAEPDEAAQEPDDDSQADFHEAITVVETVPPPSPRPQQLAVTGTLDYPLHGLPHPDQNTRRLEPISLLVDLDAAELAPAWFDDALDTLAALEATDTPAIRPREEWEVDIDDDLDDEFEIEFDIDTAEFDSPTPSVVETLSYLPRDLAEMRRNITGSVTDTMPYTDEDRPDRIRPTGSAPLTVIQGGGN